MFRILKFYLQQTERLSINKFEELEENDLIVHIEHGIGRYCGITPLKGKRHIKIEYADNSFLEWS